MHAEDRSCYKDENVLLQKSNILMQAVFFDAPQQKLLTQLNFPLK